MKDRNRRTVAFVLILACFVTSVEAATQVSFTYNALGQRQTMTDASGATTYGYDPTNNRLTSKATPQGTLSYMYDSVGSLTSVSSNHSGGVSTGYAMTR